jgi:IMP dehydrogenase
MSSTFSARAAYTHQMGLTYSDVRLVSAYSEILPDDVKLDTRISKGLCIKHPLVPASMNTITESDMAISFAQTGSMAFIHRALTPEKQAEEVRKVRRFQKGYIKDPFTVHPKDRIKKVLDIHEKEGYGSIPVTENGKHDGKLVGYISIDYVEDGHTKLFVKDRMRTGFRLDHGLSNEDIKEAILNDGEGKALLIDKNENLKALILLNDLKEASRYKNALRDDGGLVVGAAVGAPGPKGDLAKRVNYLKKEGVSVYLIDTSQGASRGTKMAVDYIRENHPGAEIIVGNIDNGTSAETICSWDGVTGAKVGIGVGSICKTTQQVGAGMPQLTAVSQVCHVCDQYDIPVGADGGISHPQDVLKALAAGASYIMAGGIFSGTLETPGDKISKIMPDGSRVVLAEYSGMGTIENIKKSNGGRYYAKGIGPRKIVEHGVKKMIPLRGSVLEVIEDYLNAVRDGISVYYGYKFLEDFRMSTVIGEHTSIFNDDKSVFKDGVKNYPEDYVPLPVRMIMQTAAGQKEMAPTI